MPSLREVIGGSLVLVSVAAALVLGRGDADRAPRPDLQRIVLGRGAQAVTVFRTRRAGRRPPVVFLHGWGLYGPRAYRPWFEHLARRGSIVIVPRYQTSVRSLPDRVLGAAVRGVEAALRQERVDTRSLVVAGHSAGGALAADLAAVARERRLPVPAGLLVLYPGRAIRADPGGIPAADLTKIAASTQTIVMGSRLDRVDGDGPARELHAALNAYGIKDLEFVDVTGRAAGDHFAPARSSATTRRVFWRTLDRLIDRVGT